MLKKMTLKLKLLTSFGIFAIIAICLGVVGLTSLQEVSSIYGVISNETTPSLNRIYTMNLTASKMQDALQSIFINADAPDIVLDETAKLKTLQDELESIRKIEDAKQVSGAMHDSMKKANEMWTAINGHIDNILKHIGTGDAAEKSAALRLFSTDYSRDLVSFKKHLNDLLQMQNEAVTFQTGRAGALVDSRNTLIKTLLGIGILFALLVGYLIASSLGQLVQSVESVTRNLAEGSERLSTSALELTKASNRLAEGANRGAASIVETAASLEELSGMVKVNVSSASEAAELSQQSSDSAAESEAQFQNLNKAMEEMKNSSQRISEIIDVIDDIAFQTNLLALNAAVEAARAGEQGKGFAVVADAVRSLAQRSADAARDIHKLINENVENTVEGNEIVGKTSDAFNSIISLIKRVAVLNGEIAQASKNQSEGLSQINVAMSQLDTIMQDSSVSAEGAAESSRKLTDEAITLKTTINQLNSVVTGETNKVSISNLHPLRSRKNTDRNNSNLSQTGS